jgi:2-dehydro-3-deoxyglucarate aldolase
MTNAVREALDDRRTALGVGLATQSRTVIEVCGDCGLDFVWLDFEHGGGDPWDGDELMDFVRAAEVADVELLVRIPSADPKLIGRMLDAGVRTLLIPQIETAADVRRAVEAARYRYADGRGGRGLAGARDDSWGTAEEATRQSDQTVLIGAMVENMTALDNLDEILDVPGLGFIFIGPEDLSMSLDAPRDFDNPRLWESIGTVRDEAIEAGIPVATARVGERSTDDYRQRGYDILSIGSDVGAIRSLIDRHGDAG